MYDREIDDWTNLTGGAVGYDDGVIQPDWEMPNNDDKVEEKEEIKTEEKEEIKTEEKEEENKKELDELIANLNKDFENNFKLISEYIQQRNININQLKLRKERLIEERDSLSEDFATRDDVVDNYNRSSRQDVIDDYNERIDLIDKNLKALEDPNDEELVRIADEVGNYKRKIYDEIRKIQNLKPTFNLEVKRLDYELDKMKYSDKELNVEEYRKKALLKEQIEKYIKELDKKTADYYKLISDLELYIADVRKLKDQRLNDIINRRDEDKTQDEIINPENDTKQEENKSNGLEDDMKTQEDEKSDDDTKSEDKTEIPEDSTKSDDDKSNDESVPEDDTSKIDDNTGKIEDDTIKSDDENDKTDDIDDETYTPEEAIQKIIDSITPDMSEEELDAKIRLIEQFMVQLYLKDQKDFEDKLNSMSGVGAKLRLIGERETAISAYQNLYSNASENVKDLIDKHIMEKICADYDIRRSKGQYCWKNYDEVRSASSYLVASFKGKDYLREQFINLVYEMRDIIKNPEEERYTNWHNSMLTYVENSGLDSTKLSVYLTAEAKELDNKLSVDKDFNINGLTINKKKEEDKPKKKNRLKVVAKKALNWAKEHKLATVAIGLALAGGALMLIPGTQMMINSALWMVGEKLGWSAASLAKLHGTNLALSKGVAGGKFAFNAGTGMYTLGGAAGAKALYTAGSAKLVGTLEGLLVGGAATTGLAAAIKGIAKKIKDKRDAKLKKQEETPIEFKIEPNKVETPHGYVSNNDGKTGTWYYEDGAIPIEFEEDQVINENEEEHSVRM